MGHPTRARSLPDRADPRVVKTAGGRTPSRPTSAPDILVIMTDEETLPPPLRAGVCRCVPEGPSYRPAKSCGNAAWNCTVTTRGRRRACPAQRPCSPGQYPSLHGVTPTPTAWRTVPTVGRCPFTTPTRCRPPGLVPGRRLPDPPSAASGTSPTPTLPIAGTDQSLATNDDDGVVIPEAVDAYRRADRLDRFGFSGWIGRSPAGRPGPTAESSRTAPTPSRSASSSANFPGRGATVPGWPSPRSSTPTTSPSAASAGSRSCVSGRPTTPCPSSPEAPSQADSFDGRPRAHRLFTETWPKMLSSRRSTRPTDGSTTT